MLQIFTASCVVRIVPWAKAGWVKQLSISIMYVITAQLLLIAVPQIKLTKKFLLQCTYKGENTTKRNFYFS
jgi:hypothetical protein